jgi:hypothetical protein
MKYFLKSFFLLGLSASVGLFYNCFKVTVFFFVSSDFVAAKCKKLAHLSSHIYNFCKLG